MSLFRRCSSMAAVVEAPEQRMGLAGTISIGASLCVIAIAVVVAMGALWKYDSSPGVQGKTPLVWPSASRIAPPNDRPVLIMFAHPMCFCSRASLTELRELLSGLEGRVAAHVLVLEPSGTDSVWRNQGFRARAGAIPSVTVTLDENGSEATRFG